MQTPSTVVIGNEHHVSDWMRVDLTHCCPQFLRFKKNSNSTQMISGLQSRQNLYNPFVRRQSSSFEFKFEALPVIWQSLPKAIPENNQRYWLQNQWQSSWGSAPPQLGLVGLARINTGCFQVGCSCCWPRQACLKKTCYHSCDIDSVEDLTWF